MHGSEIDGGNLDGGPGVFPKASPNLPMFIGKCFRVPRGGGMKKCRWRIGLFPVEEIFIVVERNFQSFSIDIMDQVTGDVRSLRDPASGDDRV